MLTHPTHEQLAAMKLHGMAKAFAELAERGDADTLSHAEWLAILLEREATWRDDHRLKARLRFARLRHQASPEDVDYRATRGLDRTLFAALLKGAWITAKENLVISGPTGVGKSWLACAIGHQACRDNRSVLYQRTPKLFEELALGHADGRYPRLMRALGGVHLLILDDWGLEPLDAAKRHDLLEIIEERYGRGATLVTTQIPIDRWHDLIGDPTYADAILDRLVHNAPSPHAHRRQLAARQARKRGRLTAHAKTRHCNQRRGRLRPAELKSESPAELIGIRSRAIIARKPRRTRR